MDELSFITGSSLLVIRKGDEKEKEWWWARLGGKEGYIPRNLLGVSLTVLFTLFFLKGVKVSEKSK